MLEGLQKLEHTESKHGLIVFRRILEAAFQGVRALSQLAVE